jgi:hypothetical protein
MNILQTFLSLDWMIIGTEFLFAVMIVVAVCWIKSKFIFLDLKKFSSLEEAKGRLDELYGKKQNAPKMVKISETELFRWVEKKVAAADEDLFNLNGLEIPLKEFHENVHGDARFKRLENKIKDKGWNVFLPWRDDKGTMYVGCSAVEEPFAWIIPAASILARNVLYANPMLAAETAESMEKTRYAWGICSQRAYVAQFGKQFDETREEDRKWSFQRYLLYAKLTLRQYNDKDGLVGRLALQTVEDAPELIDVELKAEIDSLLNSPKD